MWKALWWKEWRECSLYAGLALLAVTQILGSGMNLPVIPFLGSGRGGEIPFLSADSERWLYFAFTAAIAGIVFGLQQSLSESWRQTTLFLLHRPVPRRDLFLGKLGAGVSLLLVITMIPLLIYALWAATPGTHASPFFWGMTEPWWRAILLAVICYLGAFLAGLRPARWLGSRTWPAIAAIVLGFFLIALETPVVLNYVLLIAVCGLLVISILHVAQTREYP